jgi:hypothetical protein
MSTTPTQQESTDDLQKVIPQKNVIVINGEEIHIQQFKIGKLPLVLDAVQPMAHMLLNRDKNSPLDISSMLMLYSDDCLKLMAVLADRPRAWIDQLDIDDAVALLTMLIRGQSGFFRPARLAKTDRSVKHNRQDDQRKHTADQHAWSDKFQQLISAGHRYDDILNYTWSQFIAFSDAADRLATRKSKESFLFMLIANRGTEDGVKQVLNNLED